jgi:hypothetical protein
MPLEVKPMQVDTARMLVQAIANSLEIAIDSRNRLTAFENLLKKHRPDLFQEYQDELNDVRRSPPTQISVEGFGRLQALLLQE